MKRKIVEIDEEKCDGCGLCIPNCPEGALQIIDGKARLVSDLFCDGLGACLGHCPQDAITIGEREAEPYDERKATPSYTHSGGCPGAAIRTVNKNINAANSTEQSSALRQWPVQLTLLPLNAPFFEDSHLLISADCVPFADANFHSRLLKGRTLLIGCPKLDDIEGYQEKLAEIFKINKVKGVTVAIMEVPCCYGLYAAVEQAIKESKKRIPLTKQVVTVSGELR